MLNAAQAAVYKWTDENGQTVYSQTPPPSGTQGTEKIKTSSKRSGSAAAAVEKTKQDAAGFNERQNDEKTAEQDQKKMQQAQAERKKYCQDMAQEVDVLTTKPVVRRIGEDGEPVVLSAEEREADVKDLRERMKKDCQ
ncbi:MAG TPA: DUF4124 domain-containing protein [Gammaproteobacteria bacterium]